MLSVTAALLEQNTTITRSERVGGPISDWLKSTSFQIVGYQNSYNLIPNDPEAIAGCFAYDAKRLILAGRETLRNVEISRASDCLHPAWSAIQIYYAAFYYMSAFFRIIGQSNSYFLQSDVAPFRQLLNAQNISNLPSSGLFDLNLDPRATQLSIAKSGEKGSHEAVWKGLRKYFGDFKQRVSGYGQFSAAQKHKISLEIDCLIESSKGLASKENISTVRNEVQYRQKLDCWYPNLRNVRRFHLTDHIRKSLSSEYDMQNAINNGSEYEEFFTKGLALCAFVHNICLTLAETSAAKSLSGQYVKFDRSLV